MSLLGRFFGVPLVIIVLIVAGAITVVLLFGAPASPAPRSLEELLQAAETDAGLRSLGMLLPPAKEYWQSNLELAERIEKQEFGEDERAAMAARLAAVVRADMKKLEEASAGVGEAAARERAIKLEFLIRALGKTRRVEAVGPLLEVAGSRRWPLVNAAVQQLGDLRALPESRAAVPVLVGLLEGSGEAVTRMMACTALSVLAEPGDARVIGALNAARLAEEGEVAWNAALALARLGSDAGTSTLLDMLERSFWESGARYEVKDEKDQTRRYAMPPQRVDAMLIAAMDAASRLESAALWSAIERLAADRSPGVRGKALSLLKRRGEVTAGVSGSES